MCNGNESRGNINGEIVISKVENYYEERMQNLGVERACNSCSIGFLQRIHYQFNALLPSISLYEVKEELWSLTKIAGPITMTTLIMYSRSAVSMFFLGRQGQVELAGGCLALGFANITAISVLKGLTMGMDPICCQAFGGKRWLVLNQTVFRTICLLLLVAIPISLLWLNMDSLLQLLGQDPSVTNVAQIYLLYSIPELFAQSFLNPLRTFLRTQGLTTPITMIASIAAILHLPINYFLATYLNLGVKGIALATGLNTINITLGLLVYIFFSNKPLKPWQGVTLFDSICHGWKPLLKLAIPSCLSVCLEWWWYELMLFLCGLLNNPQTSVSTMGILIQTLGFLYVFPFSLSVSLTTRIGHSLGAGQPARAKGVAIIGILIAFLLGVLACIGLILVRKNWGKLFTDEVQIIDTIKKILPILGLSEISNWTQTVSCGILAGTARPYVGARVNVLSFYLIGLPISIFATFVYKFELLGLWYGMLAAQISCVCMLVYTLIQTDWVHQSQRALELAQKTIEQENIIDEESGLLDSE